MHLAEYLQILQQVRRSFSRNSHDHLFERWFTSIEGFHEVPKPEKSKPRTLTGARLDRKGYGVRLMTVKFPSSVPGVVGDDKGVVLRVFSAIRANRRHRQGGDAAS